MPLGRGLLRVLTFLGIGIFALICLSHAGLFQPWGQCLVSFEDASLQEKIDWTLSSNPFDNKKTRVNVYVLLYSS
jgi:hypothetical protein